MSITQIHILLKLSLKFICNVSILMLLQAFIKTAENIYEKIKEGVYDPSREGNGVKLGSMASTANKAAASKSGGCC